MASPALVVLKLPTQSTAFFLSSALCCQGVTENWEINSASSWLGKKADIALLFTMLGAWGSLHLTRAPSSLTDQVICMKPVYIHCVSIAYALHLLNICIYVNYFHGFSWILVAIF